MNSITIERTNGNIPKPLPNEDNISGFVAYIPTLPPAFAASPVRLISTLDEAEALGVTADHENWDIKVLHYQLSEIYRTNPAVKLYIGLFKKADKAPANFTEITKVQNFAGGKVRQMGVYAGDIEITDSAIFTTIQTIATKLEVEDQPLSILFAGKVPDTTAAISTELAKAGRRNISVVLGMEGKGLPYELYTDKDNTGKKSVCALGTVLGLLSRASVHQSIGWVGKFPTGIELPALGNGEPIRNLSKTTLDTLDAARYLFFVTYSGLSNSYLNDSHTLDEMQSDYAFIENVRTMDKAVRGIRTNLLPELGGSLYIDPETGLLQSYTVEHLKTVANRALEEMEKAGELSGYYVDIDPAQNVLATSTVEFVIKQVGVGVMRKIRIKIGFYESI